MINSDGIYISELDNGCLLYNFNSMKLIYISHKKLHDFRDYLNEKKTDILFDSFYYRKEDYKDCDIEKLRPTIFTGYDCNYSCDYCYERTCRSDKNRFLPEMVDAIDLFYDDYCKHFGYKKEYDTISIIGGEPLLKKNEELVERVTQKWEHKRLIVSTNGVNILHYMPILNKMKCSFNVSLDGVKKVHYFFRHPYEYDYYDRTIEGIDYVLKHGAEVNIMTVLTSTSAKGYSEFLDSISIMGWLNYEVHLHLLPELDCNGEVPIGALHNSLELLLGLLNSDYRMKHVNFLRFAPGIEQFFFEKKKCYRCRRLYAPDFVFKPNGKVAICQLANCKNLEIGSFYPRISIEWSIVERFRKRNVEEMTKCNSCIYKYACRGGCVSASINKGKTDILDCNCHYWEDENWQRGFDIVGKYLFKSWSENA